MRKFIWASLTAPILIVVILILNTKTAHSGSTEQYRIQTQVDPVFAWPSVNLDDMGIAIHTLEQSRDEIVALTRKQYNAQISDRVQKVLYPTQYLLEMLRLERLRRGLSSPTTFSDIETYHTQLVTAIRSYQNYLDDLIPVLEKTAQEQDYKGLQYHFGKSSFKHFLSVLRQYREDSDNILQTALHQWNCANTPSSNCTYFSLPITEHIPSVSIDTHNFETEAAQITSSIRLESNLKGKSTKPNWAVTTNHHCFTKHSEIYYYLWELDLGDGVPIWKADVVNDVLVHDHIVTPQTTNQYEKTLDELGAKGFVYQPYTTQYACPDLAADTGRLRSMFYAYKILEKFDWVSLKDEQLGGYSSYGTLLENAQNITNLSYLNEPLILEFMRDVSVILSSRPREELIEIWGADQQRNLEKLLLTYKSQTFLLSRDIMALVYANTAIGDYVNYAEWEFLEELLFTRNAPALLLGGFNDSINSNDYRHVEFHRKEVSPKLKSYNEELSKTYTAKEFTDILIKGTNAEEELSKRQNRSYFIRD